MASVLASSAVAGLQSPPGNTRSTVLRAQPLTRGLTASPPPSRHPQRLPVTIHFRVSASSSSSTTISSSSSPKPFNSHAASFLVDSTRTVASLAALALALSKVFANAVQSWAVKAIAAPTALELANIRELSGRVACSAGPLFYAAIRDRPSGDLNTPLTVVAAGLARWLEIYSGVLMIRVLLSWFPNIPWHRQPLSAIRDLCDPYLNLFRNIIPPIFDALDVSPLLAFAVLGTLSSILNSSKGGY